MISRRLKVVAVLALFSVVSLIGVGCGGGSGSLSKAEFIEQADAACEKADKAQLAAIPQVPISGSRDSQANEEKVVLMAALPPVQKEAEEIAELGAPAGDEQEIAAIVKGIEDGVAKAEEDPINGLESAFSAVDKRAAKYGFKACSEAL